MKFTLERSSGVKSPARKREEASLQVRVMQELDLLLPKEAFAFHCPNGGKRDVIEAKNLQRQGVKPGIPDIIIMWSGRAFGLELKSKDGRVSDNQRTAFDKLRGAGMRIEVARSFPEAMDLIRQMGVPMKAANDKFDIKDVFRDATRRRA
jgi:hypothetical protein